ncbi:MAG: peptidase [Alkalinema sp. CACIAM 70d]|nr:MAG: peptidase [Alkalinema sp. CACIAM 70d]
MKRVFRKYHRVLAIVVCFPLALTVLTGMATTLVEEWSVNLGFSRRLLLQLHTGEIFHLEGIYPLLNGLGLVGLLITGLSMTRLFHAKPQSTSKE